MNFEKRQPWNAFPLAALSIRRLYPDISPAATNVLQYLATRSSWVGVTVLGCRRISEDIGRCKDYVTHALQELEKLNLVTTTRRGRKNQHADQRTINKCILAQEYRDLIPMSSPAEQDYNDVFGQENEISSPAIQDYKITSSPAVQISSPAVQDETLQFNLTDYLPPNLTEVQTQGVSKPGSSSVAALPHLESQAFTTTDVITKRQSTLAPTPTLPYDPHGQLWLSAEDLFRDMWPDVTWTDENILMLIALEKEMRVRDIRLHYGGELIRQAWLWNQAHKTGKWKLICLAELDKALRSTSPRSLLAQMRADKGCKLCTVICFACNQPTLVAESVTRHRYGVDRTYCEGCQPV